MDKQNGQSRNSAVSFPVHSCILWRKQQYLVMLMLIADLLWSMPSANCQTTANFAYFEGRETAKC